jgi:hypothetical protein
MDAVAATIVTKPYLSHARVVARSFRAFHPEVPFFVLLADEVEGLFDPAGEPFRLLQLADVGVPALERIRFHYAQQPFSYALTPYLLARLLALGAKRVLFFKQESLILDSHDDVLDLLDRHAIVLTPHLTAPLSGPDRVAREMVILQSGAFNVGMLGVSASREADRFLRWWQTRAYDHCLHAVPEGMHYEQRWLDLVPSYFDNVHLLRDSRFNVAHWNLPDRLVEIRDGLVFVDGRRCCLFRFSGYEPERPEVLTKYSPRLTAGNAGRAADVFARFHQELAREGYEETSRWPYAYATFDNGVEIPEFVRTLARRMGAAMERFGDPRQTRGRTSFFAWLMEPVDDVTDEASRVTRMWHAIYRERPDLQAVFPDVLTTDRERFLQWTETFGAREHGIPAALLRPASR